MNLPFLKSRLKKAIERGMVNGKLDEALEELDEITVKSRADGEAICSALRQLNTNGDRKLLRENIKTLSGLMDDVESGDVPACAVIREQGIPELCRLFDLLNATRTKEDDDTLLSILYTLAMCGTKEGTQRIIEGAQQRLHSDGSLWLLILSVFGGEHPEKELLFNSLRDPLPPDFIGVSLLDAANAALIKGDSMAHPFDSPQGHQRLREWLSASDPDQFTYAHSAASALPFISKPGRDSLLELAMNHPDAGVRVEAAWVAAKMGNESGLRQLAEHCRDFKTAEKAKHYLSELGREDMIPMGAKRPGFSAMAHFASWLAHPNELGEMPDELEIIDHRELPWPPERKPKPFWLIKYTLRDKTGLGEDDVGAGLVGSQTFCLFSYKLAQRPPEDAYAVHCCWEMEAEKLIGESLVENDSKEYDNLLQQWHGATLENAKMLVVAELSPELNYPQRLVGFASARVNGEEGCVVLDGERSEWYPRSEQPEQSTQISMLKVHVGRRLLGFTGKPDRKKYLRPPTPPKPPEQIIAAYEKHLAKAREALGKKREEAFSYRGVVKRYFEEYLDALVKVGRGADPREVIQLFAAEWDDWDEICTLGKAAFKAGHFDIAEEFLLKYRKHGANYERGDEMGLLAEMWCCNGKRDEASDLLIDCLQRLLAGSKTAEGSDKALFEEWFQQKRADFLKLFPTEAEPLMAAKGIPASTISKQ
jgi:hypothetical protein